MANTARESRKHGSYHHGNLAQALVSAGLDMAAEGGPEALSLREAARRAGVSPTAVYRHFEDRTALVLAVKNVVLDRLATAMQEALARPLPRGMDAPEGAREHFIRIGVAYVDFALAHPGEYRVIFADDFFPDDPPSGPAGDGHTTCSPYGILSDVLDEMVATGAVAAEARPYAEAPAWAMVHGLASLILEGPYGAVPETERAALVAMSLQIMATGLTCR
jgi:AcrR family transcriptional regulator